MDSLYIWIRLVIFTPSELNTALYLYLMHEPLSLHIVSFNVPWPANYGGVIDVYYKLLALHDLKVKITLHCFQYEREPAPELETICQKVYYYPRQRGVTANLSLLPYNVYGRRSRELLSNLLTDEAPILFEGLHSCYWLDHPALSNRLLIVRPCNIEHHYYQAISRAERGLISKAFHKIEGWKFKKYENVLKHADLIAPVSLSDADYLHQHFPEKNIAFIPCFHAHRSISSQTGVSDFILYHAKLSVAENEQAALWLIENVLKYIPYPAVIAGMNPSDQLKKVVARYPRIRLEANPDEERMQELISQAQIHLLWTDQPTGLKLKLLNSLFSGRHIVANDLMLVGTGLDSLCHIAQNAEEAQSLCQQLMKEPFSPDELKYREIQLSSLYSPINQAKTLCDLISKEARTKGKNLRTKKKA